MKTNSCRFGLIAGLLALMVALPVWAATITVTSTADSGAGTLRAALAAAANGDTIDATGISGSITLTSGQLVVSNSVTILGPGAGSLAVNGNAASRVFHVTNAVTAVIAGLAVTNGAVTGSFPVDVGGGIWNNHSALTVSNCTISGNSGGGGIYNDGRLSGGATLSVRASTFSGNSTVNFGGGIFNDGDSGGSATLSVSASTFGGNSAASGGGGIYSYGDSGSATLSVNISTFSSNSTSSVGGGIWNNGGFSGSATALVNACTFGGNSAAGGGGGIYNRGTLEIGDTIFRSGAFGASIVNNFPGTVTSHGFNLANDNTGFLLTQPTDQINTDAMLGPLQDNGGPTFTHALLPGSPALDKGRRDAIPSLALDTDQRGFPRPADNPCVANASGGDGSDIGAFEGQEVCDFRITGIARETDNIRITWVTVAGKTNTLQRTAGVAGSFATTNFAAITNIITTGPVTNYLDIGAATNFPSLYYRVRLVP